MSSNEQEESRVLSYKLLLEISNMQHIWDIIRNDSESNIDVCFVVEENVINCFNLDKL